MSKRGSGFLRSLGYVLAAVGATVLNVAALGLVGLGIAVAVTLAGLPRADALRAVHFQEPLRIYSIDGAFMGEFGVQRRRAVAFHAIPPLLVQAFLATEDSRFFEHEGVDLLGLGRAVLSFVRTGERRQGGSTITMQVARNFFLSREKRFSRKFAELLLALHIERTLTKKEILELYLNKIFFGHRAYGISAAAALYYDRDLSELSLAQMAMLAGIPKAPSANNPVSNPQRALARRNYILGRMYALGAIDRAAYEAAKAEPDTARLHRPPIELRAGYVTEMVRRELVDRFGEATYRDGLRVTTTLDAKLQRLAQRAVRRALLDYDRRHGYRGPEDQVSVAGLGDADLDALLEAVDPIPELTPGLVVGMDRKGARVYLGKGRRIHLGLAQVRWARPYRNANTRGPAPRRVRDVLRVGDRIWLRTEADGETWELAQRPAVSGALVGLDPANGAIRALVGGYDYDMTKFNRAVDAKRQPGSSFKPFIYAAALNRGWTPASLILDEPISVRLDAHKTWKPQNFDHKNLGPIPLRLALTKSRNLASIFLLQQIGLEEGRRFATRFGFSERDLPRGLSLALGTAATPPVQMAGAYAVFANGGFRVLPHFIHRVENSAGEVLFESRAPRACARCWFQDDSEVDTQALADATGSGVPEAQRVLEPRLAYQMHSLLGDVIRYGTGRRARALGRDDIAGKTGTTNEVRDSWFCGYQKDLVAVAWMGFDNFHPLGKGETGGRAGLGLWMNFMGEALKGKPEARLAVPEGMVAIRIDTRTGKPTHAEGKNSRIEWIREEYRSALAGPVPVAPRAPKPRHAKKPKAASPRVIDELF